MGEGGRQNSVHRSIVGRFYGSHTWLGVARPTKSDPRKWVTFSLGFSAPSPIAPWWVTLWATYGPGWVEGGKQNTRRSRVGSLPLDRAPGWVTPGWVTPGTPLGGLAPLHIQAWVGYSWVGYSWHTPGWFGAQHIQAWVGYSWVGCSWVACQVSARARLGSVGPSWRGSAGLRWWGDWSLGTNGSPQGGAPVVYFRDQSGPILRTKVGHLPTRPGVHAYVPQSHRDVEWDVEWDLPRWGGLGRSGLGLAGRGGPGLGRGGQAVWRPSLHRGSLLWVTYVARRCSAHKK